MAVRRRYPVASTALLGLGLIQIAIEIGIDLFSSRSVGIFRFPHLVPSSAQPTQHRRQAVDVQFLVSECHSVFLR